MGDEDDRLAALVARPPQGVEDLGAGRVVEVAGRLVGEQERRPGDERAGDGDALLLAGRQLVRLVALLAGQLDEVDDLADALGQLAARRVLAGDRERQRDVLGDVEERDQVERLEDVAGPLAAEPGRWRSSDSWLMSRPSRTTSPLVGRSRPPRSWRSVLLPEPDGPISATNSPARRQRDAAQGLDGGLAERVDLGQVAGLEDRSRSRWGASQSRRRRRAARSCCLGVAGGLVGGHRSGEGCGAVARWSASGAQYRPAADQAPKKGR